MTIVLPKWLYIALFVAVILASYFVGVVPAEGGFDDLTTVQWLGAVIALGVGLGVSAATRPADPSVLARVDGAGNFRAGEAAAAPTGAVVANEVTVERLVEPKTYE
ncbi:hypothetical protein [Jiangella asiatica]|uniref:Uncharacterized protein n=1 Tax=Jiangella asiatica TaxID=2530372 RepID=A0A4R5CY89_9ACTN|nr:hypothetical protein [Jiangella asiatica]TDE02823.1 hypothetical protein E1269_21265 [Jiangella asiatica]